jgi:dolichol-phosphate mannosyltransferase
MSRRVLISGGSGFIGANLARRAVHDGHEVHLLLRAGHDDWRVRDLAGHTVCHRVDVTDEASVANAVSAIRPHWVFNLAAYGAYARQTGLERMMATNFWGCVHLLDACATTGVEAVVQAGSSSEYGFKAGAAHEEDRLEPNSHYAITKVAATHYCRHVARTTGLKVATVRLYSVYGPYEAPERLVPTLIVHALHGALPPLANPESARDFVYVDDAVDAMLEIALGSGVPAGAVYNVCTGVQTRLRDIVAVVSAELGLDATPVWGTLSPRAWDSDSWVGSPSKLEAERGWRARTPLAEGLRRTMRWLRADSARLRFYENEVLERADVPGRG